MEALKLWESAERLDSAVRALHPNPAEESDFGRRNTTSNRNSGSRLWTYWATQPTRRVLDIDSDIGVDDPGEFDFCSEYTRNYYAYMFSKEKKWPIMPSFMALQGGLKPETRARCVEELIKLHSAMRFIPETLFRAVSIMDHYIQECIIAKHKIDLLWKASLFVAAKLEERQNTKWRLDFINYINRVQGTKKAELFDMERDILLTLNWNLSWPLALNFLRRNCKAAQASREEELTAKFILEVCLVDYRMAWVAPSKQAAAALYCTFQLLGRTHHCWDRVMEYHSGYSLMIFRPLLIWMAKLILQASEECWVPYWKYRSSRFGQVGCFSETKTARLRQLAKGTF